MDRQNLNHSIWECNYHVVWIPKYRKKKLFGQIRVEIGKILHELASHKESQILEGHAMPDHIHMLISIPPKYSVAQVVGYMKGKSAIFIARNITGKPRNFVGEHFWARGYYVSTVGLDEEKIRNYIKKQEAEDQRMEQLRLC